MSDLALGRLWAGIKSPLGDHMEERARDQASSRARGRRRRAVHVANKGKGVVAAARNDSRIVKLVAAQERALWPKRALRSDAGLPIAERHPALLETRFDPQQVRHRMGDARSVDEAFAHRHLAAEAAS